ncbi:hypothetical protein VCHA53O466_50268 [Vibrio chagasii]|nr:hypothetical protein VCHA53O466_50268 [Vibrio chagasii]
MGVSVILGTQIDLFRALDCSGFISNSLIKSCQSWWVNYQ